MAYDFFYGENAEYERRLEAAANESLPGHPPRCSCGACAFERDRGTIGRVAPPAKTHEDRHERHTNRVALTGLIVVGLGTGASFAHPYLAWWMIPLVLLWLPAGVAIACVVGGGERR